MAKNWILNLLVVFISLGGAGTCGYLLYKDVYWNRSSSEGLQQAGIVSDRSQTVKRKFGDNMLWDLINTNEKLYWNDSIQTAEKSQAQITLDDGSKISIGESSLIVLEKDNDKLSLNLKSGQLVVDNKAADGSSKLAVNGMVLGQGGTGTTTLQVDEAKGQTTATTTSADGTGKQITIDKQGHIEEKEITTVLESPAPLARKYTETASMDISFSWQTKNATESTFEVARDRDFKSIVSQNTSVETKASLGLPAGNYYWRVRSTRDKKHVASEIRSFEITVTKAPELTKPLPNTTISYRNDIPTVDFSWKGSSSASRYRFEVSPTQDFSKITFKEETSNQYLRTSRLLEGPMFWRVTAFYGDVEKQSQSSDLMTTKLKETTPPEMFQPVKDFKLTYDKFENDHGIVFKWKTEPNETYRFVFSRSSKLKEPLVSFETTQSETVLSEAYPAGTYYWGIAHKNLDAEWTFHDIREIEVGPLTAKLAGPSGINPADNTELDLLKTPLVKWEWAPVQNAKAYKFKLYRVGSGKEELVLEDKTKNGFKEKNDLADGTYLWSVSTIDQWDREGEPSQFHFTVYHGKTLDAPDFEMSDVQ